MKEVLEVSPGESGTPRGYCEGCGLYTWSDGAYKIPRLEETRNQIRPRKLPPLFSVAANDWLKTRTGIAPGTERSYRLTIKQLNEAFGKQLLCDISADDIAGYQGRRKREGVSARTINIEVGGAPR